MVQSGHLSLNFNKDEYKYKYMIASLLYNYLFEYILYIIKFKNIYARNLFIIF